MIIPVSGVVLNSAMGEYQMLSGKFSIKPVPKEPTKGRLDFPKKFKSAPAVIVTPSSEVPGTVIMGVSAVNVTASGCDVYLTRTNNTETSVMWVAIGPV